MSRPEVRPPSFFRRHVAANADTDDVLVGLACDENLWVRREAVQNPSTPRWVLDLLVRAGADPDLRGRHDPDPSMPAADLRRLVECGPWAQRLVADHPNTTAEILDALAPHPIARVRAAVASHANTSAGALSALCADGDDEIRRRAATHPACPRDVLTLMRRAGADDELAGVGVESDAALGPHELDTLGRLGPWGRFLAGRHPACPVDVLLDATADPDWRVRSAVLDNPAASADMLERVAGADEGAASADLRPLSDPESSAADLAPLATHPRAEVRLALARHRGVTTTEIGMLALDRVADVRRAAARHPLLDPGELSLLVRAGSSGDLARLAPPDASVTQADLGQLSRGGYWARQLAVRHPDTAPETLAHLLCDEDPKLREWAAAHPSAPTDVVALLRRAGAAQDFQGIAEADPDMTTDELERVEALGPYGEVVASWHPRRRGND